jgi:hypothetical protein
MTDLQSIIPNYSTRGDRPLAVGWFRAFVIAGVLAVG